MKGYVFEDGDLELLALGILPEERREAVLSKKMLLPLLHI
jgi:hypothetical protein